MVEENLPGTKRITLGADNAYDTAGFVTTCRDLNVTPHVAANDGRPGGSALDGRTLRHAGYVISQQKRKRVEEIFGWIKTIANFGRTRYRGLELTQLAAYLVAAAYNLMRIARLSAAPA
jgi:IS5 family transposase